MVLRPRLVGLGHRPDEQSSPTEKQSIHPQERISEKHAAQPCALSIQEDESTSFATVDHTDSLIRTENLRRGIESGDAADPNVSMKSLAPDWATESHSAIMVDDSTSTRTVGNFSLSSGNIKLSGSLLVATTSRINGSRRRASLGLNEILANDDGRFSWRNGGNFGASARRVHLLDNGRMLAAELRTANGEWVQRHIDLNERIENCDGELRIV